MPTETTLNSLKVHKVPDFQTWENNYDQTNGIGTSDVVVIPPEELKKGVLPPQTNNSGKFLSTNGASTSWETVDALPPQAESSGKFLTTDGTVASWADAPEEVFIVTYDTTTYADALAAYNAGKTLIFKESAYVNKLSSEYSYTSNTNFVFHYFNSQLQKCAATLNSSGWSRVTNDLVPAIRTVNNKLLSADITLTASDVGAVATSTVGAASGIVPLNASSKIDSTYLPSYVDDVIEGYYYNSKFYTTSAHTTEITGETGKIFVDLTTNKTYRYGGSSFTEISQGSIVSVSRDLTSGTKIGTLTINGTGTDLYAPTPETFTVTGGASTIVSDNLTANRALISNTNGKVAVSDVTSTELGYLDGVTSAIQTQIDEKQAKVTASGILKGDGSGGVSAAVAGTDYQTPLTIDSTPTDGNTTHVVSSDGTYDKILARTKIYTASCSTGASTAAKVATLDDSSGFSLTAGVTVAVRFTYGNSATTPTLRVDGSTTGTAKTIAIPSSTTAFITGNGTTYNTWGAYETIIFTYNGTYWVNTGSALLEYLAYNTASGRQAKITASGILKGDGAGTISAAVAGTDYPPVNHATTATTYGVGDSSNYGHVKLSDSTSSTDGTSNGTAATPAAVKAAYDLTLARTKIYTATCSSAANASTKVATLDDSTGFSLTAGVTVLVRFTYGNSATTPSLNINDLGGKNIAISSSTTAFTTGTAATIWGAYESILFTYTGTYWTHVPSGYLGYLAYNKADNAVPKTVSSNPGNSTISHTWSGFSISIITDANGSNSFAVNSDSTEIHNVVTPTANGDAVPKSYVDNAISNIDVLPSQTNNSGKFLTTNGSALSWGTVDALPSQTGNSGKYLTTDGTTASWGDSVSGSLIDIDSTPTISSNNLVTSGGVYTALQNIDSLPSQSGNSGKYLTTNGSAASWGEVSAVTEVTLDTTPTQNSTNPITSGAVYSIVLARTNRTTNINGADTNYTTLMARGEKLLSSSTFDSATWSSQLVNGAIAWRYE